MTKEGIITKIKMSHTDFVGEIIESDLFLFSNNIKSTYNLTFRECTFKNKVRLERIDNADLFIRFHNCSFDAEVEIVSCTLDKLQFSFINKLCSLNISGKFNHLHIDSNKVLVEGDITIDNCTINDKLNCSDLNISKNQFTLSLTNKISETFVFSTLFNDSIFNIANFSNSYLGSDADFRRLHIITTGWFERCDFKKVIFGEANFGDNTFFTDCKFHAYSGFENCRNIEKTNLHFKSCLFKSFPHFNNSKFNHLEIIHTTFERKASFDQIETNTIKFYQVSFHEDAFFDEIKINKIGDINYIKRLNQSDAKDWRRTLRLIKHELQKTQNNIDYHRFKNYELSVHYKELDWKWESGFKDKFILWAAKWTTNFGNSWRRALAFTIISGLFFYTLFFWTEYYLTENYKYDITLNYFAHFINGFIRFFLITDFYNPLLNDREYFENLWSWMPFIFGKIFIAFGIYEMIQSFRKFKA